MPSSRSTAVSARSAASERPHARAPFFDSLRIATYASHRLEESCHSGKDSGFFDAQQLCSIAAVFAFLDTVRRANCWQNRTFSVGAHTMFTRSQWQGLSGRRAFVVGSLTCMLGLCLMTQAFGADVVRVEEEWELVVTTPDMVSNSPQVACAMTPLAKLEWLYMTFEINHRSDPDYVAGGLNMLVWHGEEHLLTKSSSDTHAMATTGETVRWTQAMTVQDGQVTFEVIGGSSVTWGNFGEPGGFRATVSAPLSNLNSYSPAVSVKHSGVAYASSCVSKLTLKSVRYYRADGTVQVDATPRVVFEAAPAAP